RLQSFASLVPHLGGFVAMAKRDFPSFRRSTKHAGFADSSGGKREKKGPGSRFNRQAIVIVGKRLPTLFFLLFSSLFAQGAIRGNRDIQPLPWRPSLAHRLVWLCSKRRTRAHIEPSRHQRAASPVAAPGP